MASSKASNTRRHKNYPSKLQACSLTTVWEEQSDFWDLLDMMDESKEKAGVERRSKSRVRKAKLKYYWIHYYDPDPEDSSCNVGTYYVKTDPAWGPIHYNYRIGLYTTMVDKRDEDKLKEAGII